jgi:signal transduction histidine kinase
VLAFLLVFGLVGGWILAGRMLAPLTRITGATRLAATGSLSHRIRLPGRRDEFRELADAFDAMLRRREAHVAEQRRFAANASHELRTPLAITQTLLHVARNDLNRGNDELVERRPRPPSRSRRRRRITGRYASARPARLSGPAGRGRWIAQAGRIGARAKHHRTSSGACARRA